MVSYYDSSAVQINDSSESTFKVIFLDPYKVATVDDKTIVDFYGNVIYEVLKCTFF